jgi:hypothetical protein
MTDSPYADLFSRIKATSEHSVTVYDRDHTQNGAQVIGTVGRTTRGIEAHRPHYSLADRRSARVDGEFVNVGDGVRALIADYESRQPAKRTRASR